MADTDPPGHQNFAQKEQRGRRYLQARSLQQKEKAQDCRKQKDSYFHRFSSLSLIWFIESSIEQNGWRPGVTSFRSQKSLFPMFSGKPGDLTAYVHHRSDGKRAGACMSRNSGFPAGRNLHENNYPADGSEDKHKGWSVGMFHPESWAHISRNSAKESLAGAVVPPCFTDSTM